MTLRRSRPYWSKKKASGGYSYANAKLMYSLRLPEGASPSLLCVRVRRESDNSEQDFGFVSGVVDTAGISFFCGVSRGFVSILYNLGTYNTAANIASGFSNFRLFQNVLTQQPLVYNGSSFFTEGGKYFIDFSYQASYLRTVTSVISNTLGETLTDKANIQSCVIKTQTGLSVQGLFEEARFVDINDRNISFSDTRTNRLGYIDAAGTDETILFAAQQAQNALKIYSFKKITTGGNSENYVNGALNASLLTSGLFGSDTQMSLGRQTAASLYFRGKMAEFILRNDSDDIAALMADQNLYYGIY